MNSYSLDKVIAAGDRYLADILAYRKEQEEKIISRNKVAYRFWPFGRYIRTDEEALNCEDHYYKIHYGRQFQRVLNLLIMARSLKEDGKKEIFLSAEEFSDIAIDYGAVTLENIGVENA